ncbi:MAG TPA: serine hydrolase, partial [Thermoanaerobaculia bacterium]|nr:serine hydrolase [Thermoanaerobaculia bacterium]
MLLAPLLLAAAAARSLSVAPPASAGMSAQRLARLDAAIGDSIAKKECPGAVVLVGRHGRVVY